MGQDAFDLTRAQIGAISRPVMPHPMYSRVIQEHLDPYILFQAYKLGISETAFRVAVRQHFSDFFQTPSLWVNMSPARFRDFLYLGILPTAHEYMNYPMRHLTEMLAFNQEPDYPVTYASFRPNPIHDSSNFYGPIAVQIEPAQPYTFTCWDTLVAACNQLAEHDRAVVLDALLNRASAAADELFNIIPKQLVLPSWTASPTEYSWPFDVPDFPFRQTAAQLDQWSISTGIEAHLHFRVTKAHVKRVYFSTDEAREEFEKLARCLGLPVEV